MSFLRSIIRATRKDSILLDGSVIPIADMRFGGANFKDDKDFLETAKKEAKRLMDDCSINKENAVLDIGCGTGRLPIGLLRTIGEKIQYTGVDVSEAAIAWCKRHIEKKHPAYKFIRINRIITKCQGENIHEK